MNVRDPFNLRRTTAETPAFNVVRATAAQAAVGIREKAVEVGANALERGRQAVEDMSFTVPKNVPSFGNPQRLAEDQLWASSGVTARSAGHNHHNIHQQYRAGAGAGAGVGVGVGGQPGSGLLGGVQDRVGGILHPDRNVLPMYKDKPYAHAPSYRARPLFRRKRTLGLLLLIALVFLWFSGALKGHQERAATSLADWGWLKTDTGAKGTSADWPKRRQRVVEAFELSWDAYERYAWGKQSSVSFFKCIFRKRREGKQEAVSRSLGSI